ncbi:MAG: ECF transporter S component [Oscillospiraceae bacterium]|nr:ECF transporter S component [Oscillospiraceae bacterium]
MEKTSEKTIVIARLGVMAALSVVLAALFHFPLFPAASFLEYDPADIPILLVALIYGPGAGVLLTAIVSVIQGLTVSASGGFIGILMHFLATSCFCVVASIPYQKNKTMKNMVIGLILGAVAMAAVMCVCNLIFTPLYMHVPVSVVAGMIWPIILPFNLLKACINAVAAFLLFRPLKNVFER